MQSPNLVDANIEKIAELFPNCISEANDENGILRRVVDFDQLRQELSAVLVEGPQERYTLSWPGKNEAILTANAPIARTLRPCEEESVDFENTKNLYIEGDNLDALKLLQETYLNKIKMIYFDPPYNTGKDFIFEDDFSEDTDTFLKRSNQKDEEGNRMVANTEANGRFHSDWLTMMYPRLKLASNLLADDGLIAVSIDDTELFQLGRLLDEIFGSNNKLACAPWLSEASGGKEKTGLRTGHEYLLIYYKSTSINVLQEERSAGELNLKDKHGPYRKGRELMKWGGTSLREDRPKQHYSLKTPEGLDVFPIRNDGKEGHWRWGKNNESILSAINDRDFFHWELRPFDNGVNVNGQTERWVPYVKIRDLKKSVGWSTWLDKYGANADGTRELKELFGFKPFDTPKPTKLIKWFLSLHADDNATILDFFAGSAATAQATIQLNAEDGSNRQFIMVQLPEPCDEKSEAYKAGYKTIADIGKERIRRAGKKIKDEWEVAHQQGVLGEGEPVSTLDIGFRVFKVDTSNMKDVYYTPDELKQNNLELFKDHIKPDRRPEDLLFQVFLDWGLDLTLPIAKETIDGKTIFVVDANVLLACFDSGITEELVKKLAKHKPLRAVFRDDAFGSDSVKINVEQIFKLLSPGTEVKSI